MEHFQTMKFVTIRILIGLIQRFHNLWTCCFVILEEIKKINILWAHLHQYSCAIKSSNLKCKYKKSFVQNFHTKKPGVKFWWNWCMERSRKSIGSFVQRMTSHFSLFFCNGNIRGKKHLAPPSLFWICMQTKIPWKSF